MPAQAATAARQSRAPRRAALLTVVVGQVALLLLAVALLDHLDHEASQHDAQELELEPARMGAQGAGREHACVNAEDGRTRARGARYALSDSRGGRVLARARKSRSARELAASKRSQMRRAMPPREGGAATACAPHRFFAMPPVSSSSRYCSTVFQ